MTRKEYIETLSRGLESFDESSRRDIILEIEDHIDELAHQHPDMSEEEIVAGLEKPEILAEGLCREAGVASGRKPAGGGSAPREGPREDNEDKRGGSAKSGKARITIDGEDLEEIIRRTLNIAGLFREGGKSEEERESRKESRAGSGKTLRFKDIPIPGIREISCKTKAADVKLFLSTSGLALRADGSAIPSFSIKNSGEEALEIAANPGSREPDTLEIGVPGTVGRLSVRTVSGDVLVEDRIGDLAIYAASGDVEVRQCSGDLAVETASGDVELSGCSESISVQTASGSIEMRADEECNEINISTASGDISFRYEDGFGATLRCTTVSGDVEHDGREAGEGLIQLGSGLTPVRLATVSGDIEIEEI